MIVLCVCFFIKTLGLGFPGNKFPLSDTVFIVSTLNLFLNSGEIPLDHDIMRECLSLCQRLPVLNTDSFKNDFLEVSSSFLVKVSSKSNIFVAPFSSIFHANQKHSSTDLVK